MNRCIKPRFVRLTKLEAARRQIESSIWLWFVGDDLVTGVQTCALPILVILCPIIFNIVLFHVTMARSGLPMATGVTVLALFLVGMYWDHYRHLVRQPT